MQHKLFELNLRSTKSNEKCLDTSDVLRCSGTISTCVKETCELHILAGQVTKFHHFHLFNLFIYCYSLFGKEENCGLGFY